MMAYNRNAAPYADASQTEMFGERPTKEDFVNEFLKLRNWKNYETRHSSKEGNGDAGSSEGTEPQARGGSEPTEGEGLGSRGNTGQGENIDVIPAKKDSGTHVKNTEGESGNIGLGSTDKGSRNNEGQRDVDKVEGNEPSEASLGLTKPGEQPGEKSEGAKPVGDGKEPKANPLDGMRKAAELFKDEQITKARAELAEAKKSGDASEVKRLTDKLKGLMDSTLRGKGIGLVERRKIIGEELGKAEAEKIDKPWADMEFDEQVAETEKKPLDADEIKNSDCDGVDKANAVAYLNGDKNIINTLSYLTVYDNVRNRERDSVPSSGTEDGTQLDAADNAGGEGLGRTDSRPQGVDSGQLGGSEGDGNPERGESVQSGERVSGGESGKVHATTAVGERGGEQVHGGASRVEPVSTGGTKPRGSRGVRGTGRDVRERGNEGSGNFSDEKAGEATGGRGIDSRNLSTVEQIDKEISDTQSLVDDLFNSLFDGRTKGSIISDRTNASIIPLASDHLLGKLGINKQKMAVYKQLIPALTKLGYLHIKKGVVKLNDWIDAMKGSFGGHLTKLGLSDEEVYDYIKNMWNSNIEVDGVTHKLSEWASILGTERMKKEIATPNAEKYKRQVAAEPIKVKVGDKKNIEETLPYLLPQQQEDVLRAETQFFGNEHADREHAYGKGYMFTNGTGTGKTFTGLGVAKRLVKQGKGRILIVTPSQKKVSDWIKDGRNLNMEIRDLDSIAKEHGTTATTESGEGVVITTFANFGVNKKLLETKWDAVIYDESHRIMENKNGTETARSMQHYMVTNRSENHCFLRLQETNKDYQKMKSLGERFDAERGKEVKRIQDEYKASHPSATPRDVAYATSRMLPKERNGFTPGDYASFPKLGKIHAEFVKALSHYTNEVEPKLKAQAKNEWKDTKTIFLSATPFNTRENLDYAEGYIFKYPEVEKGGRISGRTQFYLDHFGAAYKFRYNRLEQSTSNPEAVAKQEIEFSDYLQHTLGTMSGRIIDSPYDYSRDFPTVSPDHAEEFNQAVQDAVRGHGVLADAYRRTIGDYNYGSALFETMKVANIIERIKAHLDAGRKVVIFHRRVETKEPLKPPFASMLEQANRSIALMKPGEEQKKAIQAVKDFRKKYADLLEWEQTLDYSMPREQIAKVFGKDKVLFFSGKESTKAKDKAVDTFNSDDSGKNIIVIQEASGKEGISLHDTTGKHQRVCITLALPQSPITALQIEGRTYRIGNKSNAIFEYPILGLNSEMMLFGQKFNNQVSTTENLALGSQARSLRDSFANGILEHSGVVPIDQQGVGGKEFDAPKDQSTDGFDNAVLDYYSNQKLNSRNREGVDYFPTPEPLGYKMMEWANMGEGDTVLEPSAGHGAIARYAPKGNQMVAIEPSQSLFTKLQLKAGGLGRKFQNTIFENYDISNKHDVVVMNPPFGTAGATAIAHLGKAFKHLEEGGRVVALIPRGSTDKKFEKWIEGEKTAVMRAEVELPDIVFKQAGTNVVCRVVVVDKISNEAMRAKAGSVEKWDLGGHYDKIEDFFEDLRDVEMPDRIIDTNAIMMKKSKQTVKDLKELKNVTVDFNEGGINVRVRGDWNDYSIPFDMDGYSAEQKKKFLASTYETFEQQERQTRNETSQAVLAELKKLTCKLADMTEEEMQRYLKKKYEGKGVMYRIEHAAEVYNKANTHYRMELGNTFSDSKEHFDAVRDRAVKEKGIVMPNLNKEKVKVVEVEKHGFGSKERETLNNAKAWAISNLVTTGKQELPTMRDGTTYTISKKAIDKYLSESAVKKSENLDTHLSVLSKLKDVIHESIEAEIHPDYKKGEDGLRSVENGYGEGVLVHRLYGAVEIGGKMYRVKTTMQEFRGGEENKPHSYEVTKIELLDSPGKRENPDRPPSDAPNNSIDTAKLLQGVEKSYDSGKKLLDESKNLTDGETFFRKESDKSGYVSLGLSKPTEPVAEGASAPSVSERIGKAIDKAVKQTGGKVKMVNSVEEIGNEEVRRDIENGKQVTGWYDEKTGEVHLYMPNIHDSYTAEKTVWHETVGHKGMRGLLGDKFNDYMRDLWMDLDNPINAELRAYVKEKMNMNHLGFYDAIEEFIAKSAEDGKGEPGFWNYIKNKVTDALHEIGYRVSPNVKDVKYMLWLAKNVQKYGDSPLWKMRAEAVKWKIEHENVEYTKIHGGEFYENDGKNHDFEDMSREEWDEATDGQIHYRTAPSAATALDRYHSMLNAHGYMATEAFMDNMLSLDKLMKAVDPSIKKIEDVKSSMNPYVLQNTMQGAMSDKMTLFEHQVMKPLDKAMSDVLDSFAGKNTEEKIRECNLYMIGKHGLERNRVLFVRDKIREERRVKSEESNSIDALEASWKGERNILGKKLRSGQIDLREYYRQMDEWIVQNIDKDFKAEEHDYSGMHGLQEIDDLKSPYDDAGAIDSVMSQEAKMESLKKGSVDNLWKRIKDATDYSIDSDYENGLMDKTRHDRVKNMFDWYVPLRKYDEATAEDVYGYISGDNGKGFIGETLMNAKGRKSLSDVNVLAQIGAMGNRAIRNGGQNAVKQAFARFVRNSGEQNLVKETKVWVEKKGTDMNGNDIWEEAYPQIPDNASAHDIATIVDAFETDMKTKQAKGEAKTLSNSTDIGFKFARAKNKSEHFVDVKIAGRTHRFVVMGNPRAAQALNGMLENSSPNSALLKGLKSTTRFMAQMATSYSPEFVMRNIIRDAEFASSNVTAKEGVMYGKKWLRYYAELNPLNVAYNEGAGALKSLKWKDLKEGVGMGLYARYREGTLGNSKMERYFKEFMENGGETGWVQVKTMQEWEKDYKRDVSREHSKVAKTGKALRDFLVGNVENLNEVAENMARFATFCTSRDLGRSAVRSAYDAKQVSTNFNRHGSGDAIKTFKNGEMGTSKEMRRNVYGTIASYLRNYSMFFNAGVQSTHLLMNNVKKAPVGTVASMMAMPFGLGIMAAVVNNAMIASEDEKKRKGVKDPYGELPEYIRRNNLCIYKGGGEFVTIPLAIELRAFYGLGDIAAGMTAAKNVKSTRNAAMDAVGCMSQLLPVVDFMNSATFDKEPGKELLKGVSPTAFAPFVEWWLNSDWNGTPIRREGDYTKNRPAWMNAYSGTPEKLMDLNKWVNAKTNDVAPGNENMRGNSLLDEATDPAMLNHIIGTLGGGAATFITRGTGLVLKYADGREQEIETKDIPFLRSLMYTPSEQTSMARTKAKWYGYKESMEKGTSNYSMLKNKNVPLTERIRNAADRHRFEQSADYARIRIIKDAEKQMKRWNKMKRLNADDKKQVDFANKNIEMIMQKAVEQMDKVSDD
jgi:predicted RNA methylase